jgi:prolyl-tRNA synthetase
MWCGDLACELRMKDEAGMSSRCMPFGELPIGNKCAICGKPADKLLYWGVAY